LAKWKLFTWLEKKEQPQAEKTISTQEKTEYEEKTETKEQPKETPIKEYDETLYSTGSEQKQSSTAVPQKKRLLRRTSWENADLIEENIDCMRRRQTNSPSRGLQEADDVDKKVDYILLKKKSRL
jgi:hypothetical protein